MREGHPILAAVDFSDESDQALACATGLARRVVAPLVLVHAWQGRGAGDAGRAAAQESLHAAAQRQRDAGLDVEEILVEGPAAQRIAETARTRGARLVVLGRRGRGRPVYVTLGSVAERVVGLCREPVLVVPEKTRNAEAVGRILVATDYSTGSEDALEATTRLAEDLQVESLHLLHVFPDDLAAWLAIDGRDPRSDAERRLEQSRLEDWARSRIPEGLDCTRQAIHGSSAELLIEQAQSSGCDWIALGVQGRSAWGPAVVGGTTERVLRRADRPVLAVPPRRAPLLEPPD